MGQGAPSSSEAQVLSTSVQRSFRYDAAHGYSTVSYRRPAVSARRPPQSPRSDTLGGTDSGHRMGLRSRPSLHPRAVRVLAHIFRLAGTGARAERSPRLSLRGGWRRPALLARARRTSWGVPAAAHPWLAGLDVRVPRNDRHAHASFAAWWPARGCIRRGCTGASRLWLRRQTARAWLGHIAHRRRVRHAHVEGAGLRPIWGTGRRLGRDHLLENGFGTRRPRWRRTSELCLRPAAGNASDRRREGDGGGIGSVPGHRNGLQRRAGNEADIARCGTGRFAGGAGRVGRREVPDVERLRWRCGVVVLKRHASDKLDVLLGAEQRRQFGNDLL